MKIEKPHFYTELLNGDKVKDPVITKDDFDIWYDENINKMLSEGVEVMCADRDTCNWWSKLDDDVAWHSKALLINIQPIKKETREERLEAFVREVYEVTSNDRATPLGQMWNDKAKAVLEREDG